MDPVNSPGSSLPISRQVEDTAEPPQDISFGTSEEDEYPSRPSSRLGFNRPILSSCSPEVPPDSEAVQWSRSLFQNVGISDLRISSLKNHPASRAEAMNDCLLPGHSTDKIKYPFSDEVPLETRPMTDPDYCAPPPVRKVPAVSRLCFPFVTTPSPRRSNPPPSPPPPPRHKYSCFPSLMSPVAAGRPHPRQQRHNYQQHGYSRTALQHVKWFWSMREEEWETSAKVNSIKAYEDIDQDNDVICLPRQSITAYPILSDPPPLGIPPMTIYPRRGDISALRDPYCTHIDLCFARLPTWTINKTLWMYDLHMATELRTNVLQDICDEDSSDGESESELETSASTHSSDDSDTTLVESESESELPDPSTPGTSIISKNSKNINLDDTCDEFGGQSSILVFANRPSPKCLHGQLDTNNASWPRPLSTVTSKQRPRHLDRNRTPWATNWYRRWELLVDLSRQDQNHNHSTTVDMSTSFLETSPLPKDFTGHGFSQEHSGNLSSTDEWNARMERTET